MTLKNKRLAPKITELFDILEADLDSGNHEHADIILARLSKYFHIFDDEHVDYYQYARDLVDSIIVGDDENDDFFFDWDGDALASAGFGVDEDY